MRLLLAAVLSVALLLPLPVLAADQSDLMQKIDKMSLELESLKQQLNDIKKADTVREAKITAVEKKAEKAAGPSWLEIGGDYRFRLDSMRGKIHDYMQYNPGALTTIQNFPQPGMSMGFLSQGVPGFTVKNETVMLNRFGLNLRAHATEDITVKARLLMYKVWGHETETPVSGFFADRGFGVFDGIVGHFPSDNALRVDQAYATWSNIAGAPVWFSVGRRPSTGGVPSNLRQNTERTGNAGIPSILVDYAFDGLTLGVAPDLDKFPGAYGKICYGRGFDSGFKSPGNTLKDTDFLGIQLVPVDTDNLHAEVQWQRGFNIFNVPSDGVNFFGQQMPVSVNLGDIDWFGGVVMGTLPKLGIGNLNLFASGAVSLTHPNDQTFNLPFFQINGGPFQSAGFGLLNDAPSTDSHTGTAFYLGGRYDFPTGTKLGFEYNHGSKNWIGMVPASDDLWTAKLGTRGDVYETYIIQELKQKPFSKKGSAFVRLGYQYYNFKHTGSNNWVGAPKEISSLNTQDPSGTQLLPPVKNAHDIYFTFDVTF